MRYSSHLLRRYPSSIRRAFRCLWVHLYQWACSFRRLVGICRLIDIGGPCELANRLLSNENFAAFGAMFALGLAFAVVGRLDRRVDHFGVSLRGKYLLTDNYRAADRTMFAFGESCLSTCRSLCRVNYLSMPLSYNITGFVVFSVLAVSLFFALFGAGRSFSLCPFTVVVTLCRNCRLGDESLSTFGAVFAFGESCFCACRSLCRIDYFRMSLCRNIAGFV